MTLPRSPNKTGKEKQLVHTDQGGNQDMATYEGRENLAKLSSKQA